MISMDIFEQLIHVYKERSKVQTN